MLKHESRSGGHQRASLPAVDHPVHEVEAEEHDGEHHPAVLVDVAGLHAQKLGAGRGGGRDGQQGRGAARQRVRSAPATRVELYTAALQWENNFNARKILIFKRRYIYIF